MTDLFLQGDLEPNRSAALLEAARRTNAQGKDSTAAVLRRFTHSIATLPEFNLA